MGLIKQILDLEKQSTKIRKVAGRFTWFPTKKSKEKYDENYRLPFLRPKPVMGRIAHYIDSPSVICIDKDWDTETHVPNHSSKGEVKKGYQISLSECKKCEFYVKGGYCQKRINRSLICP